MKRKMISNESALRDVAVVLAIVFLALQILISSGCTRRIYVPVEHKVTEKEILRDTVVNVQLEYLHDSIATYDSVSVLQNRYAISRAEFAEGRLLHVLATRPDAEIPVRIQYVDRLRIDSIPVPYEVEKPTKYKPTKLQLVKYYCGGFVIALIGIAVCIFLFRKVIKRIFS
jgi:hypothetical protein